MNLPILERLGVLGQVATLGVPKLGADFTCSDDRDDYRTYLFARALGDSPAQAFEVRRSEFDQLLFENCAASGVDARQGETVTDVRLGRDGRHEVTSVDEAGRETLWRPGFVVDASGRNTLLSSKTAGRRRTRSTPARRCSATSAASSDGRTRMQAISASTGLITAGSG